jgi:hypothetical protein
MVQQAGELLPSSYSCPQLTVCGLSGPVVRAEPRHGLEPDVEIELTGPRRVSGKAGTIVALLSPGLRRERHCS